MSYEEPETWELCGVSYKCDRMKANEIAQIVFATPEWVAYSVAKESVVYGTFRAGTPEGRALVTELVLAYRAAFAKTLKIVKVALGDEAA